MSKALDTFFEQSDIGDGPLTPEQAAALMALAEQGDTAATADNGGAPDATPGTDSTTTGTADAGSVAKGASTAAVDESNIDPDKAVVLAKDGVHHIPYATLEKARQGEQKAREGEQHWRAQAEAAQRQLADLQEQAASRVAAGQAPTEQDNMVAAAEAAIASGEADASLFGDFSEEALAAGIARLVQQRVAAEVGEALKPLREQQEQAKKQEQLTAAQAHMAAILEKHPDATSVYESAQFDAWIKSRPTYEQAGIRHVLQEGATGDVIELFDQYKAATGTPKPAAADALAAAAKAAASAARAPVPETLSGIPGGRAGATSVHEQLDSMDGVGLANAMAGMSPAQIEAFLNRTL